MSLRPSDVGRRVVVRYRLATPVDGAHATDVLGVLSAWTDGQLVIETKSGTTARVAEADVLAAKVVPPRTVTRREVRDLEAAASDGWRALDVDHLGGWLLRASDGFTRRANACLPLSDPDRPLAAAIDEVARWYDARRLPPTFQLPLPLSGPLGPALDARGWLVASEEVLVMTSPLPDVADQIRAGLPPLQVMARPDDAWLARYHYRGGMLPPIGLDVLLNAEVVGFAAVDEPDRRVAIARGAVTDAPSGRRWLGVTAVEVDPAERRRGLGSHVVAGVAEWAAERGATDVYLQVSVTNQAALAAYERLGFTEHHRYVYRRRPALPTP